MIQIEEHPFLDALCFETVFPAPLGEIRTPDATLALFGRGAQAPLSTDDSVKAAVRDLLRHGGYRPTGRGKPASEYLLGARERDALGPINAAVDACNAASLHSGLPISVVDLDRAVAPLRIAIAAPGSSYVFNRSGQEIDLGGLLCLFDADGPCANAVKDAQRTKTDESTTRTFSVVWGTRVLEGRTERTVAWYRELLASVGATTRLVDAARSV
ncbi:MAG: hypothetical protein R3F34_12690 [Planctomycetota bacterium]